MAVYAHPPAAGTGDIFRLCATERPEIFQYASEYGRIVHKLESVGWSQLCAYCAIRLYDAFRCRFFPIVPIADRHHRLSSGQLELFSHWHDSEQCRITWCNVRAVSACG